MKLRNAAFFVALSMGVASTGCATKSDQWVELNGTRYQVEVADSEAERAQGLMFRDEMAEDRGMFFVHPANEMQAYWMKNTKIPLDILYFDPQLKLVSQSRYTPPCSAGDSCPPYPSSGPAQYVLELNAGQAEKLGLKEGDTLTLSKSIPLKPNE